MFNYHRKFPRASARLNRPLMTGIAVFIIFILSLVTLGAPDPQAILQEIYNRQDLDEGTFILEIKATTYEGTSTDTAKIRVYLGEEERQMVTFVEPERLQNQKYLVVGYNTWMHQQGLRRPIRISARQKLFGDAGIAETVSIDYLNDYKVINMKEEGSCYLMELTALDAKTAYQKARIWVEKEGWRLKKSVLLALNGEPLKELIFRDYQRINGHEVAVIDIKNLLLEKNRHTELQFIDITRKKLPVEAFQPLMMGKFELMIND